MATAPHSRPASSKATPQADDVAPGTVPLQAFAEAPIPPAAIEVLTGASAAAGAAPPPRWAGSYAWTGGRAWANNEYVLQLDRDGVWSLGKEGPSGEGALLFRGEGGGNPWDVAAVRWLRWRGGPADGAWEATMLEAVPRQSSFTPLPQPPLLIVDSEGSDSPSPKSFRSAEFGRRCDSIRLEAEADSSPSRADASGAHSPFDDGDSDTSTSISDGDDAPASEETDRELSIREKANMALEVPDSSRVAMGLAALSLAMILASTVTLIIETVPRYQAESRAGNGPWFLLETVFVAFFLAEISVRVWAAPDRVDFFKQVLNVNDIIAILPYFVELIVGSGSGGGGSAAGLRVLRVIRVVRVVRLLKVARYAEGIKLVIVVFGKVWDVLVLVTFVIVIALLVWSSCIFYIEAAAIGRFDDARWTRTNIYTLDRRQEFSPFQSIYDAFWWCISTITVVGYGDHVPYSGLAKLVAAVAMISATFIIAIPASVFGSTFLSEYQKRTEQQQRDRVAVEKSRSASVIQILDYLVSCGGSAQGGAAAHPRSTPAEVALPVSPVSSASSRVPAAGEIPDALLELVLWDDDFATAAIQMAKAYPVLVPEFVEDLRTTAAAWEKRPCRKAAGRYAVGALGFEHLHFQGPGTSLRSAPTLHALPVDALRRASGDETAGGGVNDVSDTGGGLPTRAGRAQSFSSRRGSTRRIQRIGSIVNDASHLAPQARSFSEGMAERRESKVSFSSVPLGRALSNASITPRRRSSALSPRGRDHPLRPPTLERGTLDQEKMGTTDDGSEPPGDIPDTQSTSPIVDAPSDARLHVRLPPALREVGRAPPSGDAPSLLASPQMLSPQTSSTAPQHGEALHSSCGSPGVSGSLTASPALTEPAQNAIPGLSLGEPAIDNHADEGSAAGMNSTMPMAGLDWR
eukprot:TRINITY_DN9345_c0_g1_i1.p1 TRINITY_DN9345_c0_g1~~TRINITY_DN9345_c0_g1_i1.p1  ORF type:complete len:916 (+),score=242.69 TRINITY_DN9345_c0_g1_i1:121-2868(+)